MKGNSILTPSSSEVIDDSGDHSLNMFDDLPQREEQIIQPEEEDEEEQEFEFSVAFTDPESSTISADEIFHNGRIRPIYPLFDTSLIAEEANRNPEKERFGLPLGRLLKEERGTSSSSSSDELEGLAPGTYCVWTPNREAASPGFRKKSNSTGSCSSNRWKLRNILSRSSSEGRDREKQERESILKRRR